MGKINKRLLPIKAHYLFLMGAMGPILPQLPVLGKQIGISPEVMGYITAILPIMYVIAKPLFGFIADYFMNLRKFIFLLLIIFMILSFGAFYFIPNDVLNISKLEGQTFNVKLQKCSKQLLLSIDDCFTTYHAKCSNSEILNVQAFFISHLNISRYIEKSSSPHLCVPIGNVPSSSLNFSCKLNTKGSWERDCVEENFTFWLFLILMFTSTIGFNVVNSISDAICFDILGETEVEKYGAQRVWGTIGFGITALFAGIAVDQWTQGPTKSLVPALIIMFIFSCLDVFSVSKLKLPKLSSSESIFKDVWKLISEPWILVFLVFVIISGIIDSFIVYFLFWHVEEVAAETGFMNQIKLIEGCVVAAECLAGEVPFFFYSGKLIKNLGISHCMSLCFFFYAIRFALIAWIPNPWYLVGVELFFQGCTYALCYTCVVAYASTVAPPGTSATVQGLMAGMDDGVGFSIGSLIGGLAYKNFGGRRSFAYFAILSICTCVVHIFIRPTTRKQRILNKNGYILPNEQCLDNNDTSDTNI